MKLINKISYLSLFLLTCIQMISCNNDERIYVSMSTREVTIYPKDTFRLHLKVEDLNTIYQESPIWSIVKKENSSTDNSIISINEKGLIQAIAIGHATVKATIASGRYALTSINVIERPSPKEGVNFEKDNYYISIGSIAPDTIKLYVKTKLLKQYNFSLKSTDKSIIIPQLIQPEKVDEKSIETVYQVVLTKGGQEGVADVIAQFGEKEFTTTIHVGAKSYLSFDPINTALGEPSISKMAPVSFQVNSLDTIKVYYRVTPNDQAHLDALDFEVSSIGNSLFLIKETKRVKDQYYIIVQTGILKGETVMKIRLNNNTITANCTVMNRNDINVESILFSDNAKQITTTEKALSLEEEIKISPISALAYWPAIWSSSNKLIATVDNIGNVLIKKAGTFKITATSKDKFDVATITSKLVVESMSFAAGIKTTLTETEKTQWSINILTNYENSDLSPKWESSTPSVAKVDQMGNITGLTVGTTTISASVVDNMNKTTTIQKEVKITSYSDIHIYNLNFNSSTFNYLSDRASSGDLTGIKLEIYDPNDFSKYYIFTLYKKDNTTNLDLSGTHTYTVGTEIHTASTIEFVTEKETATLLSGSHLIVNNGKISFQMKASKVGKTITITGNNITEE